MSNRHAAIDIPVPNWKPKNDLIPETVSNLPQNNPETEPYMLSFQHYNNKECQIKDLIRNIAREALRILKEAGSCHNLDELKQKGIDILRVNNSGSYVKLFNRLSPEVEIREHKIQGSARIFYYISDKRLNVVAFTNTHLNID